MSSRALRLGLRAADVSLAGAVAVSGACVLLARHPRRRRSIPTQRPRLMALASMHTLSVLRTRQAEHLLTHRDLDGYFDHVWNVHPLVGAHPGEPPEAGIGPPTMTSLAPAHTMVEGKTRRLAALAAFPYLDFVLAQLELVLLLDDIVCREGVGIIRGDPYYHGLLALLLGRLNRRAVELRVVANHDAIYEAVGTLAHPRLFRFRRVEQCVAHYTLSHADSVVVGSADNRVFALRNGASASRVASVGNGTMISPVHLTAPDEREALEDEFGLGDRPTAVCVSRLEPMKHPEDVVISVAKARRNIPRLAGVVVGDGAMRGELAELCEELGVVDDVIFAGERDQRWIARLLAGSTVVVAPIAGLSLVESALSGTPIVAYDYEWHSEFIRSDEEGLLVPYRDTDAMAAAICALVGDPDRASRVAAAARARALEIMQPDQLLARERELADRLLARP